MEDAMLQAALKGSVNSLQDIMKNDDLILNKFVIGFFSWNPLHVAASQGHENFVQKLLSLDPNLSQTSDSKNRSALHLAAAKGHIEVVKILLSNLGSEICLEADGDGRYPLHLAAKYGKVQVLEELLLANADVARARLERGETILHLCVKHNQFEALKILLKTIEDEEFVNAKDEHGQTILHMLVYKKQVEVIEHVLEESKIHLNATNLNDQTALDVSMMLLKTSRYKGNQELNSIKKVLIRRSIAKGTILSGKFNWYDKKEILAVIFSLLATNSFLLAYNPPGGVWQDTANGHLAGKSVLSFTNPLLFGFIISTSMSAFILSLMSMYIIIRVGSGSGVLRRVIDRYLLLNSILIMILLVVTFLCSMYAVAPAYAFNFKFTGYRKDQPKEYRQGTAFASILVVLVLMTSFIPFLQAYVESIKARRG